MDTLIGLALISVGLPLSWLLYRAVMDTKDVELAGLALLAFFVSTVATMAGFAVIIMR